MRQKTFSESVFPTGVKRLLSAISESFKNELLTFSMKLFERSLILFLLRVIVMEGDRGGVARINWPRSGEGEGDVEG